MLTYLVLIICLAAPAICKLLSPPPPTPTRIKHNIATLLPSPSLPFPPYYHRSLFCSSTDNPNKTDRVFTHKQDYFHTQARMAANVQNQTQPGAAAPEGARPEDGKQTWGDYGKQVYNAQYERWMPWIEDMYLRWFTKDNKASYATKGMFISTHLPPPLLPMPLVLPSRKIPRKNKEAKY